MNISTHNLTKAILSSSFLAMSTLLLSLLFAANVQAKSDLHDEKLIKVCEAIQADKMHDLRRRMKDLYTTPRKIIADLKCNGMDPLEFASLSGAKNTVNYLNKHTKRDSMLTKK